MSKIQSYKVINLDVHKIDVNNFNFAQVEKWLRLPEVSKFSNQLLIYSYSKSDDFEEILETALCAKFGIFVIDSIDHCGGVMFEGYDYCTLFSDHSGAEGLFNKANPVEKDFILLNLNFFENFVKNSCMWNLDDEESGGEDGSFLKKIIKSLLKKDLIFP